MARTVPLLRRIAAQGRSGDELVISGGQRIAD